MPVIKWFLWRRWQFKRWVKGSAAEPLSSNLLRVNLGSCRDYPIIYRDMLRIIAAGKHQEGE